MLLFDLIRPVVAAPLGTWTGTVATAAVACLVASFAFRIGRNIIERLTRSLPMMSAVLRRIERPARWLLLGCLAQLVLFAAADALAGIERVRAIITLVVIGDLTWLAAGAVAGVSDAVIGRHSLRGENNLQARRIHTQTRVIARCAMALIVVIGAASMLMTFPNVRQIGASLLASAGVAGLVAGIAARPVLGNMIAGLQIALSQPIRIDDVVVIQGEWGRVEDITGNHVAVKLWDERRLIVPLQWLIENPFQNWTRTSSHLIGSVFIWVDYRMPLAPLRDALRALCERAPEWDQRVCVLQVTDANERAMQLRALVSSANSSQNWDLRCRVREGLLDVMRTHYPEYLPRVRAELPAGQHRAAATGSVFGEA
jgi:small-conductance mechanosensitive channel